MIFVSYNTIYKVLGDNMKANGIIGNAWTVDVIGYISFKGGEFLNSFSNENV